MTARYHFNFRHSRRFFEDVEGAEFSTLAAAVEDGRLAARELLNLDRGRPDRAYHGGAFEITGPDGLIHAIVRFYESRLQPLVRLPT